MEEKISSRGLTERAIVGGRPSEEERGRSSLDRTSRFIERQTSREVTSPAQAPMNQRQAQTQGQGPSQTPGLTGLVIVDPQDISSSVISQRGSALAIDSFSRPAIWRVAGHYWGWSVEIVEDPSSHWPPRPTTIEEWEVGFVQLVVRDRLRVSYSDEIKEGTYTGPALDSQNQTAAPWMTVADTINIGNLTIRPWYRFRWGGSQPMSGAPIIISMSDSPCIVISFYRNGNTRLGNLQTVDSATTFRTLIVARKRPSRGNQSPRLYVLAYTNLFTVVWTVDRTQLQGIAASDPHNHGSTNSSIDAMTWTRVLGPGQSGIPSPVISPLANLDIPQYWIGLGVTPQRIPRGLGC